MKNFGPFFNEESENQREFQYELHVSEALDQLEKGCIDSEGLAAEQPAKWFIKDLIRIKQSGILGGPWKSGKSFAAIHISKCINYSLNLFHPNPLADLLGSKTGKICKSGSVLYIASEDGGSLRNRVLAWDIKYDPDGHLAAKTKNKIWWYRKPLDLLDGIQVEAIKRFCKKTGVVMVVVDTLASCISARGTAGNIENDNALMTLLMENLGSIVSEIKGSGFFVHHPCKGDAASSRGAGAIEASSRFKLQVSTTGENSRQLSLAFNNDAPADGISFSFQIESVVIGIDPEDESEIRAGVFIPIKQSGSDPSLQEDKVLKYASDLADESGKISRKGLKKRCEDNGIANYRTPLARLKEKGFIVPIGTSDKNGSTAYMQLTEGGKQYLLGDHSLENPAQTITHTLSGIPIWT